MAINVSIYKNDNKRINDAKNLDFAKNKCCWTNQSLSWIILAPEFVVSVGKK